MVAIALPAGAVGETPNVTLLLLEADAFRGRNSGLGVDEVGPREALASRAAEHPEGLAHLAQRKA